MAETFKSGPFHCENGSGKIWDETDETIPVVELSMGIEARREMDIAVLAHETMLEAQHSGAEPA